MVAGAGAGAGASWPINPDPILAPAASDAAPLVCLTPACSTLTLRDTLGSSRHTHRSGLCQKVKYLQCSLFSLALVHCWLSPVISTDIDSKKTSNVWISLRYPWSLCTSLAVYTHCCVVGHEGLQLWRLSQADPLVTSTQRAAHFTTSQAIVWEPGDIFKHSMIPFYLLHTLHEPSLCCLKIIADIQASVWHKMVCYVLCLPKTTVYSFTTWPHCRWKIL